MSISKMFNTDHYHSRYFNHIFEEGGIMNKSSTNIEKIVAEYNYYYLLPPDKQRFFIQPFDLMVSNDIASYKMEFIKHKNLAELFAAKEMTPDSFESFLDRVDEFKAGCYRDEPKACSVQSEYLILKKTAHRLKGAREYDHLLDRIFGAYLKLHSARKTWRTTLSHGDLCFSNIIWIPEIEMIKMIDPRGAKVNDQLYMDEYYDLAKLSHSIFGGYESVIYSYSIDYSSIQNIFLDYLSYHDISFDLIRLYEASLFLSMIPLHKDNPNNIDKFINICDNILQSLDI